MAVDHVLFKTVHEYRLYYCHGTADWFLLFHG